MRCALASRRNEQRREPTRERNADQQRRDGGEFTGARESAGDGPGEDGDKGGAPLVAGKP